MKLHCVQKSYFPWEPIHQLVNVRRCKHISFNCLPLIGGQIWIEEVFIRKLQDYLRFFLDINYHTYYSSDRILMNMFRTTKNPKKRWDSDVESEKANIWERKIHVIKAGSLYQIPRQIFVHCPFGNLTHKVILYTRTLRLNMARLLEIGCYIY